MKPLISICIPAYKRADFLARLLDSISFQTYQNFEVVITDDSNDDTVYSLVQTYKDRFNISYCRNEKPLGPPANWNAAIKLAHGEWIKLMHDDDWFRSQDSLQVFADAAKANKGDFIFSAYYNIYLQTNREESIIPAGNRMQALQKEPAILFARNIIGPPSVIMHRNDQRFFYDRATKWVVDIDFYIRRLATEKVHYIDQPLINVGMSDQQVTMDCIGNRKVQIPENFYLLNKIGTGCLQNVLVYDAWWRLMRNLEVVQEQEIRDAGYDGSIHPVILSMVNWQRRIPRSLLTKGIFSKISMFAHYLTHRNTIAR